MHAALEAVGVLPGDEVIIPPLSVVMSTTSVLHANAIPVYADVELDTYNLCPIDVESKITDKTKAIVVVSLYGLPANLPKLREIADKYNIALIEDNAQCVLGTIDGQLAGSFGDFASFSFENTKHLSCGEGGMLITDDEDLAMLCRKIGGHGFKNLRAEEGRVRLNQEVFQNPEYKRHDILGWNYRLSEFSAAIALAQLERVETLVDLRKKNAEIFLEVLSKYDFFMPQATPKGFVNSYYTLGIVYTGDEQHGVSWKKFRETYVKNGGDGIYSSWAVTYDEPVISTGQFKKRYPEIYSNISFEESSCKNSEYLQKRLMQFKTNYRDISLAQEKADILELTIKQLFPK